MGVASLLGQRFFAQAGKGLAQLDSALIRLSHQPNAHLVIEPGVGGKGDGFFLHRGVRVHLVQVAPLDQLLPFGHLDGLGGQFFPALRTNAVAEFHQGSVIERQLVLEVLEAAKVLPAGILNKPLHHRLVALVEGVLEIMQAHHQTDRRSRPALAGAVERAKRVLEYLPFELAGKLVKGMFPIQNLIQMRLEQFQFGLGLFRGHKSPAFGLIFHDPGDFMPSIFQKRTPKTTAYVVFQGRLNTPPWAGRALKLLRISGQDIIAQAP